MGFSVPALLGKNASGSSELPNATLEKSRFFQCLTKILSQTWSIPVAL